MTSTPTDKPDLLTVCERLAEYLEESHADDVANGHHGDDGPCSYCDAIAEARAAITEAEAERAGAPNLLAVVLELIADADAAPEALDDWPDLAVTVQHARAAIAKAAP